MEEARALLGVDLEQLRPDDRYDAPLLDEAQEVFPGILVEGGMGEKRDRAGAHAASRMECSSTLNRYPLWTARRPPGARYW
jgi:hypothetical protein